MSVSGESVIFFTSMKAFFFPIRFTQLRLLLKTQGVKDEARQKVFIERSLNIIQAWLERYCLFHHLKNYT